MGNWTHQEIVAAQSQVRMQNNISRKIVLQAKRVSDATSTAEGRKQIAKLKQLCAAYEACGGFRADSLVAERDGGVPAFGERA